MESISSKWLEPQDERYQFVKDLVVNSCANVQIYWIEEIINDFLTARYLDCKDQFILSCGDNLQELVLFHGTRESNVCKIIQDGFKASLNVTSLHGKGTYFAKDASLSINYVNYPPEQEVAFLFLCNVLVGRTNTRDKQEKEPHTMESFDVLVDNTTNPSQYVIPHDAAIYPRYAIAMSNPRNPKHYNGKPFAPTLPRRFQAVSEVQGPPKNSLSYWTSHKTSTEPVPIKPLKPLKRAAFHPHNSS